MSKYSSAYDIPLRSVDGEENFLSKFRGKVTLFINTTGDCGNAPQFGIIERLYQTYKDHGFQVVAVPTNDYCGPKVTYGIYEDGISNGKQSEDYAKEKWGVTYPFSEMIVSRESRCDEEEKHPHPLYGFLNPGGENTPIFGNFEKFIVDKNGHYLTRIMNGALLDYAYNDGQCDPPEVEYQRLCGIIEEALNQEYTEI
jgi:glutathione peroxidase